MATTSRPQINSNDINNSDNIDSYSGSFRNGRGERRNFMSQGNKLGSSRQTMATEMTSSRFASNSSNHSHNKNMSSVPIHSHTRNGQMRNSYNSHSSRDYQPRMYPGTGSSSGLDEERELQRRRAEENAAWVKMLEEESLVLQGADKGLGEATARIPNRAHHGGTSRSRSNSPNRSPGRTNLNNNERTRKAPSKGKMRRSRSEGLEPAFIVTDTGVIGGSFNNLRNNQGQHLRREEGRTGAGPRDDYRRGHHSYQHNVSQNSGLSGRSRDRVRRRDSLQNRHQAYQPTQQPHDHYDRCREDGQQVHQQQHYQHNRQQQQHEFQRDIPLELDIPSRPNGDGRSHDFLAGGGSRSNLSVHSRGSGNSVHSRSSHQRRSNRRQQHRQQQHKQQYHHRNSNQNQPGETSQSFAPPVNPLLEESDRQEFEIDLNTPLGNVYERDNYHSDEVDMDEMLRKNHSDSIQFAGEDWRHSRQRHTPRNRCLTNPSLEFQNNRSYEGANSNNNQRSDRWYSPLSRPEEKDEHRRRERGEDFPIPPPGREMSLVQAIHNLELENGAGGGNQDHLLPLPPPQTRPYREREMVPESFDAILVGDGNRHQHHSHRDGNEYERHYRSQKQQQPLEDNGVDSYQHRDRNRDQRGRHHNPPMPPHQSYDEPPQRLKGPIETLEFPTNWDGAEIEATLDDELLDRDEDEYYRRRNEYIQQQQQQQQQHSQSSQLTSPNSQPRQHHSPSQQQHSQQSRSRQPIRRLLSSDSNFGGAGGFASDLYSQNIAVSGHRVAPMQIEVSPGVSMPFRGSEETWEAIAMNRIMKTECLGCSIQLYCVEDAELVVCPDCQTMSPAQALGVEDDLNQNKRSGLGLGFKEEQLVQWRHA